jgi:preprotein translocase subunit SecD
VSDEQEQYSQARPGAGRRSRRRRRPDKRFTARRPVFASLIGGVLSAALVVSALILTERPGTAAGVTPSAGVVARLTFTPTNSPGSTFDASAYAVLRERFHEADLPNTALAISGSGVVVTTPEDQESAVSSLMQPGDLEFRPVVKEAEGGPADSSGGTVSASRGAGWPVTAASEQAAADAAYGSLKCAGAARPEASPYAAADYLATCSKDGTVKYLLGPSLVSGRDVTGAAASLPRGAAAGAWQIDISFDEAGSAALATVTTELYNEVATGGGSGIFAIVLDGVVQSAPTVQSPILGGQADITGGFTESAARGLAALLTYGSLPVDYALSSVTG